MLALRDSYVIGTARTLQRRVVIFITVLRALSPLVMSFAGT